MNSLYLPPQLSLKELKPVLSAFEAAGYDTDAVRLGVSWEEFLKDIPDGATVVVYSVDFFPSLMELLSTLATLQERGIALKSLQEPWLSGEIHSTPDFLTQLRNLATVLHTNRTKKGIQAAQARGVKVGRPRLR